MTLIRTSLLTAVAVIVRLLTALFLNKVLAAAVGPAGYAVIGQLQNIMSMSTTFAAGALGQGVTKYTAEYAAVGDDHRKLALWRTAGALSLIASTVVAFGLAAFSAPIARQLLFGIAYQPVIFAFAASLVLMTLNGYILAILNGLKEVRLFVIASIAGSLVTAAVTGFAAYRYGLTGALLALATNQAVALLATLLLCWQQPWFRVDDLIGRLDVQALRGLGGFALMAATTALTTPVAQIVIRRFLTGNFSLVEAGYWDAMTRLSTLGMLFATSTLSVYYLPRLSEAHGGRALEREVRAVAVVVVPVAVAGAIAVYLLRAPIIALLFDASFLPMQSLFRYQLVGDVLKVASWIYAYVMIGRAMTRSFIATEIAFSLSLVGLSVIACRALGFEGVALAYAINNGLYWLVAYGIFRRHLREKQANTARLA
jgi:PST family polysaccharide transporter